MKTIQNSAQENNLVRLFGEMTNSSALQISATLALVRMMKNLT